ncbi:MAG TPA: hypothetical protein VKB80_07240 [Kofleriaceae bacterium]|nr:hypothetical protein [Kofleriaceae bacterium]
MSDASPSARPWRSGERHRPPPATLVEGRALGALTHLVAKLRLARDFGLAPDALATWSLDRHGERGYHDEWIAAHGRGNLERFLGDFLAGRSVLYDESWVTVQVGGFEVRSRIWYHDELPEAFFYFDVSPEEFTDYVIALGCENARRLGVELTLVHEDGFERAVIRALPGPPTI